MMERLKAAMERYEELGALLGQERFLQAVSVFGR